MSTSFITCYKPGEIPPDEYVKRGVWVWDPYSAILMILVGRRFLADTRDAWKRAAGEMLIGVATGPFGGGTEPRLEEFNHSRNQLLAFRNAYADSARQLLTMGEWFTAEHFRQIGGGGPLFSGNNPVRLPTRDLSEMADQIVTMIDDYLREHFDAS